MTASFRPSGASNSPAIHTAALPGCYFDHRLLADGFGRGVGSQSEFVEQYWTSSSSAAKMDLRIGPLETFECLQTVT